MPTYFGFSDECGDYSMKMTSKQLARHPFYIRSTFLMNSNEWKVLSSNFRELKRKYGLPLKEEIKWAYLWSLKYFNITGKPIPETHDIKIFEKFGYQHLVAFVSEALQLINQLNEKKIIVTYTDNVNFQGFNEKKILAMHLQNHMQRVELELTNQKVDSLAVLFFDPVSPAKNEYFRELYYELFESGDYVKYGHIKDSLNIENSHHSVGIQLADYISGAFSSVVKSDSTGNYSDGIKMFFQSVHGSLRNINGNVQGWGIIDVPSNSKTRNWMTEHLKNMSKFA